MEEKRIIIDLRPKPEKYVELDADLIIEVDRFEDRFVCSYAGAVGDGWSILGPLETSSRKEMVGWHVQQIRERKPKSVVIRTGKHSTGHVQDIPLHPGVINSIIEGKLDAEKLTLPG